MKHQKQIRRLFLSSAKLVRSEFLEGFQEGAKAVRHIGCALGHTLRVLCFAVASCMLGLVTGVDYANELLQDKKATTAHYPSAEVIADSSLLGRDVG